MKLGYTINLGYYENISIETNDLPSTSACINEVKQLLSLHEHIPEVQDFMSRLGLTEGEYKTDKYGESDKGSSGGSVCPSCGSEMYQSQKGNWKCKNKSCGEVWTSDLGKRLYPKEG